MWPLWWQPPQPGPRLGGTGEPSEGRGPSPSPWTCHDVAPADHPARASAMAGSLLHTPQVVFKMPSCPFRAFPTLRLAQVAPPPGSPSLSNPGPMPPLQLTQPLWVSPATALTSRSLPHQTGSEPLCTDRVGRGGLSVETVSRSPHPQDTVRGILARRDTRTDCWESDSASPGCGQIVRREPSVGKVTSLPLQVLAVLFHNPDQRPVPSLFQR